MDTLFTDGVRKEFLVHKSQSSETFRRLEERINTKVHGSTKESFNNSCSLSALQQKKNVRKITVDSQPFKKVFSRRETHCLPQISTS
jgi:hypothetical protein